MVPGETQVNELDTFLPWAWEASQCSLSSTPDLVVLALRLLKCSLPQNTESAANKAAARMKPVRDRSQKGAAAALYPAFAKRGKLLSQSRWSQPRQSGEKSEVQEFVL